MSKLDESIPLTAFSDLRQQCSALREIFIPDELWPAFRQWYVLPDGIAAHSSVVLLACRRGFLPRVTEPIHRYLLSPNGVREDASKQYVKDLRGNWMLESDPLVRHRRSRIFRGRLVELPFAEWLESQTHIVTGLEAIRNGPDIETVTATGKSNSFEVKFVGLEDSNFETILRSMGGHPTGGTISAYQPINYMLFRVYEAGRQLRLVSGRKVAVVVIDEQAWYRFDLQIRNRWIDWNNPQFISPDAKWNEFCRCKRSAIHVCAMNSATRFEQSIRYKFSGRTMRSISSWPSIVIKLDFE